MRVIRATVAALAIGTLLLGTASTAGAKAKKAPKATESLESIMPAFEEALKTGDCAELGEFLLISALRVSADPDNPIVDPSTPPTADECVYVEQLREFFASGPASYSDGTSADFRVTDVEEFGTGGVAEGTVLKVVTTPITTFWALDRDGQFRLVTSWTEDVQLQGGKGASPKDFDDAAKAWTKAVQQDDCASVFEYFAPDSPSIMKNGAPTDEAGFCASFNESAAAKPINGELNAFAGLQASPKTKPTRLGVLPDVAFYGLALKDGRYVTLIVNTLAAESAEHNDPAVINFVTNRRPND